MKRTREERVFDAIDNVIVTFYCGVAMLALAPIVALGVMLVAAAWLEEGAVRVRARFGK